ncbi:MAG: TIGR00730 family Rossman fold protein [Desulfatitalea sp.]|nr:TIGR00730 family Rossman fold protein [Desulfatitalea sp.]NNK01118.1 TIGR00730 family Rossman fold protein [Desulfatitalea sp.]
MKRICVYCGSSSGSRTEYLEAAAYLGRCLAKRGVGIVYGGAQVGLMGTVASSALNHGGEVIGVIPELFAEKVKHNELSKLYVVPTMHDRKKKMYDLSDGFMALPGGIGTIEEFFEILAWAQLGCHKKPCGILNVLGYFDGILEFVKHSVHQQFLKTEHREMIMVDKDPDALLKQFEKYKAPTVPKWIDMN